MHPELCSSVFTFEFPWKLASTTTGFVSNWVSEPCPLVISSPQLPLVRNFAPSNSFLIAISLYIDFVCSWLTVHTSDSIDAVVFGATLKSNVFSKPVMSHLHYSIFYDERLKSVLHRKRLGRKQNYLYICDDPSESRCCIPPQNHCTQLTALK